MGVLGERKGQFCYFQNFIAFLLIIDNIMGFESNLNAFMRLLLNKKAHEYLSTIPL